MWVEPDFGNTMTRMETAHLAPSPSARPRLHPESAGAVSGMTLNAFLVVYIRNHVNQLTVAIKAEQTSMIRRLFVPLSPYALSDITPLMIEEWFHGIGEQSQSQANKSLTMLRTMFARAKDWRVFAGENPASRVRKFTRHARTRFVKPEEMPALMTVLQQQREDIQCFFLLCLLVGCRRSEGLTLKWADLDLAGGLWHKSKTKTGFAHTIPIPRSLFERLDALPRINEWVFATQQGHWCRSMASERWTVIRRAAGLDDVTIHDLRRTSCLVAVRPGDQSGRDWARGPQSYKFIEHGNLYPIANRASGAGTRREQYPHAWQRLHDHAADPVHRDAASTRGGAGRVAGMREGFMRSLRDTHGNTFAKKGR